MPEGSLVEVATFIVALVDFKMKTVPMATAIACFENYYCLVRKELYPSYKNLIHG